MALKRPPSDVGENSQDEETMGDEPILSYDEFVARDEEGMNRFNNFPSFFRHPHGLMGQIRHQQLFFIKFVGENSQLYRVLYQTINSEATPLGNRDNAEEIYHLMYDAYVIMRGYTGEYKVSNKELFA